MNSTKRIKDIFHMREIKQVLNSINPPIAFRRALVDLTGSVQAALMLSQAIYWQERATQVDGWWYKTMEEWEIETGLTRNEQATARKKCRKYLSSDLRNIPARLYWKVNREALMVDLKSMNGDFSKSTLRTPPNQVMEKPKPSLRESADQVMGNNQKRIGETSQLDNGKDAKINRYAENTSGNSAEINAEIYSHNGQGEAEVEKEKRLLLLIKGCSRVMPEEDPAGVGEVITRAMDTFSMEWVRQAINEAALRNKRSLQGILEILQMWEKSTPSKRPLKP